MTAEIIVTGAEGMLGRHVVRAARDQIVQGTHAFEKVIALSRQECDITNVSQVREVLRIHPLAIVINCAGIVKGRPGIDMANVNGRGPHVLARFARRVVQVSTDCVFTGRPRDPASPYKESSVAFAVDEYGESKHRGELLDPPHLTVRGSFVGLGPRGLLHFLLDQVHGARVEGYTNWMWNGSYVRDYADYLLRLATHDITGVVHLVGPVTLSKHRLLQMVAQRLRPDLTIVETRLPVSRHMILGSAKVPPMAVTWTQMLEHLEDDYRDHTSGA